MNPPVSPLPPRVIAFVQEHVSSLLQLEALLLVFEGAQRTRSAEDVSAEMYLPAGVVDDWLSAYADSGFCERVAGGYRLRDDSDVYELLAEVADTYVRRKVSMGRLVFGATAEDPKISLAEAFTSRTDEAKDE